MELGARGSSGLEPIDAIIPKILISGSLSKSAVVAELWGQWKNIAGEDIAQHCFPEKYNNGKLYIKVDSPIWRQQLDLMKEQIKEKIDRDFHHFEIDKIIFR